MEFSQNFEPAFRPCNSVALIAIETKYGVDDASCICTFPSHENLVVFKSNISRFIPFCEEAFVPSTFPVNMNISRIQAIEVFPVFKPILQSGSINKYASTDLCSHAEGDGIFICFASCLSITLHLFRLEY